MISNFIERHDKKVQRFLEIVPGIIIWTVILFPLWGAFIFPHFVAYVVLLFIVFWFYRSFQAAILGLRGYRKIKEAQATDWKEKYEKIKEPVPFFWEEIKHVVIITTVNEPLEKLRKTLKSLAEQDIGKEHLVVVLGFEERAVGHRKRAEVLLEEFENSFSHIWATYHPANIPGEIVGKAANEAWAARWVKKKLVAELGYDIKKLTVTSCDADAILNKKYFSALNYEFIKDSDRYVRFWQAPIFWHNNIDEVPAPIRIVGTLGSVIHLSDIQEPRQLFFNYSVYSMSFKLIDDVDYWDTDFIPEDWHIFLKSFFRLNGEVEVNPIFLPLSIDAPQSPTYVGSLINRYEQCKRHAWGATDIPYAIKEFFKHPEISLINRTLRVYKLIETHLLWSTNWVFLSLGATIPTLVNPVFEQTVLGQNLPRLAGFILTSCLGALLVIITVDAKLRPKGKSRVPKWRYVFSYLEWLLMPIATLFMSALPGLEAHTRLMLGKYIEYRVTEKI